MITDESTDAYPWDHLPNAYHINLIYKEFVKDPAMWSKYEGFRNEAWNDACDSSVSLMSATNHNIWRNLIDAGYRILAAQDEDIINWFAYVGATRALIAYDDCGYMLYSDPDELEVIARLGNHAAILLLPACKTLAEIRKNPCHL